MRINYVLIDFENVQPESLAGLQQDHFKVLVFVGANQTKVPFEVAHAMQSMGGKAEYVKITGNGSNALDFHIAFYIGQLSAAEPGSTFRIISKDKGFDPLVRHLNARGISCQRLAEIPVEATKTSLGAANSLVKPAKKAAAKKKTAKNMVVTVDPVPPVAKTQPSATATQVKVVLACLAKSTKPSKVAGLRASIKSWFKPPLDDKAVNAVLQSLQSSKKIIVTGTKVAYAIA